MSTYISAERYCRAQTPSFSREPALPYWHTRLSHSGFGMRPFLRHVISSTVCPLRFSTRTRPCSVYFMFSPTIPLLGFLGVLSSLVSASIMLTSWSSVRRCVSSLAIALCIRAISVLIAPRVGSTFLVMLFLTSQFSLTPARVSRLILLQLSTPSLFHPMNRFRMSMCGNTTCHICHLTCFLQMLLYFLPRKPSLHLHPPT